MMLLSCSLEKLKYQKMLAASDLRETQASFWHSLNDNLRQLLFVARINCQPYCKVLERTQASIYWNTIITLPTVFILSDLF